MNEPTEAIEAARKILLGQFHKTRLTKEVFVDAAALSILLYPRQVKALDPDFRAAPADAVEIERLKGENAELRAERDALLQKPIDLAKMDSIDDEDDTSMKMIAYYWWEQVNAARAALADMPVSATGEVESLVLAEVAKATIKFPTWPTDPLHAVAILGEEFGELTKAVLQYVYEPHKSGLEEVKEEAIQTAAMAVRFLMSLDRYEYIKGEWHTQEALI